MAPLSTGPGAQPTGPVGSGLGQIHDFNPGILPSGLFWTQPVPEDALDVSLEAGTASLALKDLDEEDYHNLHNALLDGPSDEARSRRVAIREYHALVGCCPI